MSQPSLPASPEFGEVLGGHIQIGTTVVAPSPAALALGFFAAVIVMGVVTVQAAAFSSRSYKDRKASVTIVNILVLYNCVSLALLGESQYQSMITRFRSGNAGSMKLARRYLMYLIPNFVSRSIASYALAITVTSICRSSCLRYAFKILVASRITITALGLCTLSASIRSNDNYGFTSQELPQFAALGILVGTMTECVVCALFCGIILCGMRSPDKSSAFDLNRIARNAVPAYLITIFCQLVFAIGIWHKSAFVIASFGIPLNSVSNAALLALLLAHPSALTLPLWMQRDMRRKQCSILEAGVSITQDITTTSCHDGPLEIGLMERLEVFLRLIINRIYRH
ncbi:hypothetical protein DL93DRAFT_2168177 [Clavulina sp. PMI_390]|nr:hypothetical protein DL93DRAFT_2168177 [Clavulina sp. PMI_390]